MIVRKQIRFVFMREIFMYEIYVSTRTFFYSTYIDQVNLEIMNLVSDACNACMLILRAHIRWRNYLIDVICFN